MHRGPSECFRQWKSLSLSGIEMTDSVTRLNAALEGRYAIERELGEGGMVWHRT